MDLEKGQNKILVDFTQIRVRTPESVSHGLEIDKRTGTDFWRKAIEKEIRNVFPAFDFVDDDATIPSGYEFVEAYFVFDVKMDLTRKARLVARDNMRQKQ